jgi:endo-1,4-beta-D-glucanase Y
MLQLKYSSMNGKILLSVLFLFLYSVVKISEVNAQINTPSGVVPFGTNLSYGFGIKPTNLPTGGAYGQSQDAANAYNTWKANYVVSCGGSPNQYRVKFDDINKTVSEGIAYGMLLAAYASDKDLFDGLWAYYRANRNGNNIMNWRISGCSGTDGANGATDAEFDAAMALLIAENQWPLLNSPYDYSAEATTLITAIKNYEMDAGSYQARNGDGWSAGIDCRNPSYQAPAYYKAYAAQVPAQSAFWTNAVTAAYNLVTANAHATTGLVSDWCNSAGQKNQCNGGYDGYGYDACRHPWRMAVDAVWNNDATGMAQSTKIANYAKGVGASSVGGPRNMDGSGGGGHSATFVSMYAVAVMGSPAGNQTFMNQIYSETVNVSDNYQTGYPSGYFGNTLRTISLFMMSGNFWKPGTSLNQEINVKATATSTNIPSAGTYDFQNVVSTGNKVVTFTIENQGQLALSLSGTPIVNVTGPNSAQFVVTTQPSAASIAAGSSLTFVVTFTPGSTGSKTAQLSIASNDANENPYTINLTGTGTSGATSPEIDVVQGSSIANGGTFTWASTTLNATSYTTFTINNTGTAPLNITSATVGAGQGYSMSTAPASSIAGGASGTFVVKFNPTSTGVKTGTITLVNDDSDEGSYVINLTGTSQTCSNSITNTEVIQDYDANNNVSKAYSPVGAFNENVVNPYSGGLNTSPTVASYTRQNSGTYDGIRYQTTCGINFPLTGKTIVSMMVYSPAVGVPVLMSLKTISSASVRDVTVYTRTSGQWEKLYFDFTPVAGNSTVKYMDIFFHPTTAPGSPQTFYIDNIKYDVNPCTAGIPATNILTDYDQNVYLTTVFGPVGGMNEAFANPFPGGLNTSTLVNRYVRTTTQDYDVFRYSACGTNFDLSPGKQKMTMLIYTANVGDTVIMSLKTAGGATVNDAIAVTTTSNAWELLTFDHSAIVNNTTAALMDIMIDPKRRFVANATQWTYYIDNIRYSLAAPEVDIKTSGGTAYASGSTYAFGTAAVGSSTSVTFLVQNNGTGTLSLSGTPKITISGTNAADFIIDQTITTSTVSPLSSTTFIITFNPSATGAKTAAISIANDDANENPYIINLTGTASGPEMNVKVGAASYATASSYDFGSSNVGAAVGPVTFTIENTGNAILNLSGTPKVVLSGTNAADFTVTQTATTATVAATTGTTTFTISFNPSASGARSASISIANDDANENPYVVNLTGTGTAPEINVKAAAATVASAGSYDFGSSNVGTATAATTFTIENLGTSNLTLTGTPKVSIAGTNAADFTIVQTGVSSPVAAAGNTTFTITFNPGATGSRTAAITITNNDSDEGSYVINLTGTGTAPEINVKAATASVASAGSYDFGSSNVGTATGATTFTIENLGTSNLTLSGTPKVSISGTNTSDFTIVQTGVSSPVAAAGNTTFTITFNPSASGSRTAAITILNNDSNEGTYVINLTGTGTAPEINVKAAATSIASGGSHDFGSVVSGSSGSAVTFTIENTGNMNLTLSGTPKVAISGTNTADFTIVQTGVTSPVAGAGTTTFTITFSPSAIGSRTAAITIANDDSNESSYVINLTGTGTSSPIPEINVKAGATNVAAAGSFDFGSSPIGTATSATTFTIENIGTASLTLSGTPKVSIAGTNAGDFTIVQTGVTSPVATAGTTTFTITFNPSATGARTAAITILNNDSDEGSYVINLTGTGTVALPSTQTITGPATVNPNQAGVTYSVPAPPSGSAYTWSLPPGSVITSASSDSSSITVTFGTTGGTVALTETNGAGSTTSNKTITMSGATSISTGLGSDTYLNYPSPFTEETTLRINASATAPLSIRLSDVKGNPVYQSDEFFTNEDINLGKGLASGVYMVQISYGSKVQIIKIVKL